MTVKGSLDGPFINGIYYGIKGGKYNEQRKISSSNDKDAKKNEG